jgi:maltose O-acetyltransferase
MGVNIFDGVEIGAGTIIGAGSLVTKDLPSNVKAFGSPARVKSEL